MTPEDFWSDLANWWIEATKKTQELADAAYKKELEQAAATGDAKAVAAVQAKYTVSNLIKSDPRFNGSDKKNLDEINQHAESLAPQARLDFYLKLGAEVFKGVQDGNVGEVKKTLNALSDDPKKIERWSRWAAEQSPGGQAAIAGLRGSSLLGGLGKLARTRPSATPYVRDPRQWTSPPNKPDNSGIPGWAISLTNITFGIAAFDVGTRLDQARSLIDFSIASAAYGANPNRYLIQSYEDFVKFAGPIGKFLDGAGYFLGVAEYVGSVIDIRDSDMNLPSKFGAMAMEAGFGVGQAATGLVATEACVARNGAGNALACGAASMVGIEVASTVSKNFIKKIAGWEYGK